MKRGVIIGIDVAGTTKNPTGWAFWRASTTHEIDATTAALTGYLYLEGKTELIGDEEEGYIVVPMKTDWRTMRL